MDSANLSSSFVEDEEEDVVNDSLSSDSDFVGFPGRRTPLDRRRAAFDFELDRYLSASKSRKRVGGAHRHLF